MRIATTDARGREDAAAPGRPSREVTMALGAMGEVVGVITAAAEDLDVDIITDMGEDYCARAWMNHF